jgi:uncharacterized membrane protein
VDWFLFAIQWLHVLLGIVWFGSSLTTNLIVIPAIGKLTPAEQQRFGMAYGQAANRVLRPAATLVILLGILRGTVFGQLHSLNDVLGTAYGITWLVGLIAAIATFSFAEAMIAPNIRKLNALDPAFDAEGKPTPEAAAILTRAKRNALLELLGFGVIFTCMILMRFGY